MRVKAIHNQKHIQRVPRYQLSPVSHCPISSSLPGVFVYTLSMLFMQVDSLVDYWFILLYLCVCGLCMEFVCVHVCMCGSLHVCGGRHQCLVSFSICLHLIFFRLDLSLNFELTHLAMLRWVARGSPGASYSCFYRAVIADTCPVPGLVHGCWGYTVGSPSLCSKDL